MFQGNRFPSSSETAHAISDGIGLLELNTAILGTDGMNVMKMIMHCVVTVAAIVYMRDGEANNIVPWVLCGLPFVCGALDHLTVFEKSFHLYSISRILTLSIVVYALTVWYTTNVGDEVLYLNLVFLTVFAV